MPKGGHARSGPPPDPNALRRDRTNDAAWLTLPAARLGDPPQWPLTEASSREMTLWAKVWATPQATQWELLGQEMEVALYVRRLTEAERPGSTTAAGTLVRQMADSLGLTIAGLRVNRWRIAGAEAIEAAKKPTPTPGRSAARDRFRVVHGDAS